MKKYQDAFNTLLSYEINIDDLISTGENITIETLLADHLTDALSLIQEAIDKAIQLEQALEDSCMGKDCTEHRLVIKDTDEQYRCPRCGSPIIFIGQGHCDNCGQLIDWSEV